MSSLLDLMLLSFTFLSLSEPFRSPSLQCFYNCKEGNSIIQTGCFIVWPKLGNGVRGTVMMSR